MKRVGIVMGSASDLPIVEKAIKVLEDYEVPFEVRVLSAHRCPVEARDFAATARESGFSVLIAAAGMAAGWSIGSEYDSSGHRYSLPLFRV